MMLRVSAPHFCAGVELCNDVVVRAAPILGWSLGKERSELERYFTRKGWKTERLDMTTHLMVDIETLGTRPGAIVLAAAFVRFSDEAHVTLNLSVSDQEALKLERDPSTEAWWAEQERTAPGAWEKATANPTPLAVALPYISTWLTWASGGGDFLLWCHGASFDAPLLEEVFRRAAVPCPWKFWSVRDTRTLYDLAGVNPKDYAVPPPHVALNDALGQTRAAVAAMRVLAKAHGVAA